MTQQTDALGRITRFGFDKTRRQISRTLPLGMTETFTYDAAGEKTAKKDFNGYTTTYGYDARARLVAKVPDPAKNEAAATFAYTPTGRREQAANGSGIVRYTYDLRDRMVKKQMPAGTLSYTYDPHGNVATMKSSNAGGVDIAYGWDAANRLVSVTDPAGASTIEYDGAGRMTKRTDPNGLELTYAYDQVSRVLDVTAKRAGTPIAQYTYTRDAIGRVTTAAELGGRTVTYGYSVPGRLANETISGDPHTVNGSISYTHDAVGNRLTRTSSVGPVPAQAFSYDANDRISDETYDQNGNTLSSEGNAFLYDFEDRLVAINSGVTLTYDAAGNLGSRMEAGTKVAYLVDELSPAGYTQVVEEVTVGVVSKSYAYGRMPLRSGNQTYIADGHTDVRLLVDASGAVTDEYDYEAFGVGTRTTGSSVNALRYTGERVESAGLTFLRARHMKNGSGRFTGMDPLAGKATSPGGLNRYLYVQSEPIGLYDRSGLFSLPELSVSTAIVGVMAAIGTYNTWLTVKYSAWTALAFKLRELGHKEALQKYPSEPMYNSMHNGVGDAYRHCWTSCELAKYTNVPYAKALGYLNEWQADVLGAQPPEEKAMDLANNQCGFGYGSEGKVCSPACMSALWGGKLTWLIQPPTSYPWWPYPMDVAQSWVLNPGAGLS